MPTATDPSLPDFAALVAAFLPPHAALPIDDAIKAAVADVGAYLTALRADPVRMAAMVERATAEVWERANAGRAVTA